MPTTSAQPHLPHSPHSLWAPYWACPLRPLLQYRLDSAQGADGQLSQALLLSLYREPLGTAWGAWAARPEGCVAGLLEGGGGEEVLRKALAAHNKVGGWSWIGWLGE